MDWSKSTKVLIIALVIANIILIAAYVHDRTRIQNIDRTRKFARIAERTLREQDIKVATKIPRKKVKMTSLRVSYEAAGNRALNQRYFDNHGEILQVDSNLTQINHGWERLSIHDGRQYIYENYKKSSPAQITQAEAEEIGLEFLSNREYPVDDLKLVQAEERNKEWHLLYTMMYRGDYLESTYTEITVAGGEVKEMSRLWLNVLEEGQTQNVLPPAAQVILSLLDNSDYNGKTIISIEPCYFFSPEKQGTVEGYTKSMVGRATPAWRIEFSDGEELVLDNQ